jgi:hypothetical protein
MTIRPRPLKALVTFPRHRRVKGIREEHLPVYWEWYEKAYNGLGTFRRGGADSDIYAREWTQRFIDQHENILAQS